MILSEFSTAELVRELQTREGVEVHEAGLCEEMTIEVDAPGIVLVVIN